MFPDTGIAKKIIIGRTQMGYVLKYERGSYFKNLRTESMKKLSVYSLSFDKNLYEVIQEGEVMVMVRY